MSAPAAPTLPQPHPGVTVPPYYTADEVLTYGNAWLAHSEALQKEIESLQPKPEAIKRFPGEPPPGKMIMGLAPGGDDRAALANREAQVGQKLAFRQYHHGSADFAVPNGLLCQNIKADHQAGRVSVISPKPGHEALAAHKFGAEVVEFFKWTEAQPGITLVIVHHEGENDWPGDFGNLTKYAKHQADYREAQKWVRTCLNQAAGGKPKKTVFIGCLMSYSWSKEGVGKFGPADGWNPGLQADGTHVWDVACLDHYLPGNSGSSFETPTWKTATDAIKKWGTLLGVAEFGAMQVNPNGGKALGDFLKRFVEVYKGVIFLYFDSSAGAGGVPQADAKNWWILTDANGTLGAFKAGVRAYNYNPNG